MAFKAWLAVLAFGAAMLDGAATARAGLLQPCDDVTLPPSTTTCEVLPPGADCTDQCTPAAMDISCASETRPLCAECLGDNVGEDAACSSDCVTECTAEPASYSCAGTCGTKCFADCPGYCSSDPNQSRCIASCQANCALFCDGSCDDIRSSTSCEDKCRASCKGLVIARANMDCELDCQAIMWSSCATRLTGRCRDICQTTIGALFCDVNGTRQYVQLQEQLDPVTGAYYTSLDQCVDALQKQNITVDRHVPASGCQMGSGRPQALLLLLGLIPLVLRRRRPTC